MRDAVRQQYETFPDPSPTLVPIDGAQLDRIDDNLHFGWSWHRHRYCYRRAERLRVLDAGCGTGLTTLALARLNPGATVLGVDASARALDLARQRTETAGIPSVSFQRQDLDDPWPGGFGPYDFVVCRGVLGQADDPSRVLANLARVLDARGLLLATFPAREGRAAVRQFRRAIEALAPAGASLAEKAAIGLELFGALRPDHPIRQHEARYSGLAGPSVERIGAGYLNEHERDWSLSEAVALVEGAGLRFLYAAAHHPWQADRAFTRQVPEALKTRVAGLPERDQAILIDALDPTMHRDEYRVYACPADFEPRLPAWPERRATHPEVLDGLIPYPTGLVAPAGFAQDPAAIRGRVSYRVVTGAVGELDRRADLLLGRVDGRRTCGQIDREVSEQVGTTEADDVRRHRWLDLADHGFLLLESPDPRQHIACIHQGSVRDRLDCPCPRLWVRACERHGLCTIDEVADGDPRVASLGSAFARLGAEAAVACATCRDYEPEE